MIKLSSAEQVRIWADISAVAYAVIDADGQLIESNKGFDLTLPAALQGKPGIDVRNCFMNPDFNRLVAANARGLERTLFTIGAVDAKTYSLSGWFLPHERGFMFLAEHDISGLAKMSDTLLEINKELSRLQRDLLSANRRLKAREQQIRELSLTDPLTGLGNRRRLDESIETAISHATRHQRPLSVMMIDIDHFKAINDDFGHEAGDRALRAFADALKQHSRKSDLVARFGGEEFIVLMPESDVHQAKATAERMGEKVAQMKVPPIDRPITASFGVAQMVDGDSAESLLVRSDQAMYLAKAKGRNRVEVKMP
jgi:two-component system cell cycle response regulator